VAREKRLSVNSDENRQIRLHDFSPGRDHFRAAVLSGLQKPQKELPCKYLYDERGSLLYDRICTLDEYYIPRTEASIMETHIEEMDFCSSTCASADTASLISSSVVS